MSRFYEITCGADTVFNGSATLGAAKAIASDASFRRAQPATIWQTNSPKLDARMRREFMRVEMGRFEVVG